MFGGRTSCESQRFVIFPEILCGANLAIRGAVARCCPKRAVVSAAANMCLWWLAGSCRTSAMMMGHHLLVPLSFSPSPKLGVMNYAIVSEIRYVRPISWLVASASILRSSSCFIHVVLVCLQLALKSAPVANSCNRYLLRLRISVRGC